MPERFEHLRNYQVLGLAWFRALRGERPVKIDPNCRKLVMVVVVSVDPRPDGRRVDTPLGAFT